MKFNSGSMRITFGSLLMFLSTFGFNTLVAQSLEFVKDFSTYNFYSSKKTVINSSGETFVYGGAGSGDCAANNSGTFVAKFDVNRNCLWFTEISISPGSNKYFDNIILDNSGNVIILGRIYHLTNTSTTYTVTAGSTSLTFPAVSNDYTFLNFIFKISTNGSVSWGKTYYENATVNNPGGNGYFETVTCDASNNIYLSGSFSDLIYDGVLRTTATSGVLLLVKISSSGTYNNLVTSSTSSAYMATPRIIYNSSSGRIFFTASGSTTPGTGITFSNGATLTPSATEYRYGLYCASLNTSMAVSSQVFYGSITSSMINNYNAELITSGDSVIYANTISSLSSGSISFGSNILTADPTYGKIFLVKFSSSNPNTVIWLKQFLRNGNTVVKLARGQGDQVFLTGIETGNIDFGNSVELKLSSGSNTLYLLQFKATNGNADWVIKIPTSYLSELPDLCYSTAQSNLYLNIYSPNVDGVGYANAIYTLNRKLVINSISSAATLCPGATVSATFTSTQTPSAGNIYSLQLSSEEGMFNSFTTIGTLTSTALTGTITGTIPASLEGSPVMKLRVVASNPVLVGAESKTYINVATPNNTLELKTVDASTVAYVCDQLNVTLAPPFLYGNSFQWQINTGSGFTTMSDNSLYSGTTTGALNITAAPLSISGYQYKLLVKNSACPSQTITQAYTLTVRPRPSVTSTTPVARCDAGTVALTAVVSSGATARWYNAATSGTYLGAGSPLTSSSISGTTTFYADAYLNGCYAFNRMALVATVYTTPSISSAPAVSRCGNGSVTLSATSAAGTINWYTAATGGSSLLTGPSYATPSLSASTTYYADASANGCTTSVRTSVAVTINTAPQIGTVNNFARCDSGAVTLSATINTGTINWFTAASGGSSVHSGTGYSLGMKVTTTFYLEGFTATCTTATRTPVTGTVTLTPTIQSVASNYRCGPGTVLLGATPSGGTVNWYTASSGGSPVATSLNYTTPGISATTTYYAEAIHNTCTNLSRMAVVASVYTPATFSLSKTNPSSCGNNDGSISVSGLTPFSFYGVSYNGNAATTLPTNGSGIITVSNLVAGAYNNFTITTQNNCNTVNAAGQTLSDPSAPSITSATPDSKCGPGGLTLNATASGGTINWYAQASGGSILATSGTYNTGNLTATTTFYVEASVGSCLSGRTPVVATIHQIPALSGTKDSTRCGDGSVELSAIYDAGITSWYAASTGGPAIATGSTFTTPSLATTTTYYVDANNNGCPSAGPRTAVIATIANIPSITSSTNGNRCGEGTMNLLATASPAADVNWYTASSGGSIAFTGTAYTTPYLSSTTIYYAEARLNACISARTAVAANVLAIPAFTLSKTDASACQSADGSLLFSNLNASSSYTLQYNGGAAQPFVTDVSGTYVHANLSAQTYSNIQVTDANACNSITQTISISEPPGPSIDAGAPQTACDGDNVVLTATNPDNAALTWSTGETTTTISFTAGGNATTYYTVSANLLGCISKDSVPVKVRYDQTISSFPQISDQTVFSQPFTISASSSSGLPVTFTSLDPFVATVAGDQITIVGPGTAIIQASQAGDLCNNPSKDTVQTFVVSGKLNQKITFLNSATIVFGEAPYPLGAIVNSPNTVQYLVSDPQVLAVTNGMAVGLKAGTTQVKAYALASSSYNASDTMTQLITVVVPNFRIIGSTLVEADVREEYLVSPTSANYSYSWRYFGANTYLVSDSTSFNTSLYFTKTATGDSLRCRVRSIASNTFVDVWTVITVLPPRETLTFVDCDTLGGNIAACQGKFINAFHVFGETELNAAATGCDAGYSDFSRLSGVYTSSLYLGEMYSAQVEVSSSSGQRTSNYVGLWIDYNNNGDFSDANEFLISTYSPDSIIELKNILITTNTEFSGVRRLRLRVRSTAVFTFNEYCVDVNESGETEDYQITLLVPDRLEAPVLLSPNDDGKNDFFVIKGIKGKASANKLTILDRVGTVLYSESNYANTWGGTDVNKNLLPSDTYYYNFVNGDGDVINGYFEIRY